MLTFGQRLAASEKASGPMIYHFVFIPIYILIIVEQENKHRVRGVSGKANAQSSVCDWQSEMARKRLAAAEPSL
jgi:hypothetical protein